MNEIRLTRTVYDQIRAHGELAYPNECCGALLGRLMPDGWHIDLAVAATNVQTETPTTRYEIAPIELIKIDREARSAGLAIAGFYHSHPDHPAQWSATDFAEAHWLGCCYVITEIVHGKAMVTNSFFLKGIAEEDKRFESQAVALDD